jgi:hypothetical protein
MPRFALPLFVLCNLFCQFLRIVGPFLIASSILSLMLSYTWDCFHYEVRTAQISLFMIPCLL